ncbi:ABC transporter ATP-binding protein [Actinomarinicola tropica]|uniref:ATP-binding cassette domain-containing protein n=1 Tax=Actinomarinicola tropica TaxID=2789776 RepID=A0A5Q2RP65_9ACTN|nr:ABC transporter ATP-binding protein [Actinomarinicola tropica]QGG94995.1 ATP-binding cassette domain-containing protein [Actinomarinicola tropica]
MPAPTTDVEPTAPTPDAPTEPAVLLELEQVSKTFPVKIGMRKRSVSAVDGVDLLVREGSTVGIVGESGCGKSTLARLIVGLVPHDDGTIRFAGQALGSKGRRPRSVVEQMQMVFQDPYSALNPKATIGESIAFPLRVQGVPTAEIQERVGTVLTDVGLHPNYATHYPHQLSGGQRQRVNIARALALHPRLVVLDEAVSALDKSIQAQILNLLDDLQEAYGLTYVFISHDLNVVEWSSDEVAVMYLGRVVETCPAEDLYRRPLHPYTQGLLASIPKLDPRERAADAGRIDGEMPSPLDPPSGCRFRTRCPSAHERCAQEAPVLAEVEPGHRVACHLHTGADVPVEAPSLRSTPTPPTTTEGA